MHEEKKKKRFLDDASLNYFVIGGPFFILIVYIIAGFIFLWGQNEISNLKEMNLTEVKEIIVDFLRLLYQVTGFVLVIFGLIIVLIIKFRRNIDKKIKTLLK